MALMAKKQEFTYDGPVGTIHAVCAFVFDIGLQRGEFQGKKLIRHQAIISWELNKLMDDGRPYTLSKFYTLSLGDKATLRKDIESWNGKLTKEDLDGGFDIEKMVGKNCLLNIQLSDKGKARVMSVMACPEGMPILAVKNKQVTDKMQAWIDKMLFAAVSPEDAAMEAEADHAEREEARHEQLPSEKAKDSNDLPF